MNGGFRYANNFNLCGVGFSLLRACSSHDQAPNKPESFKPNSNPSNPRNNSLSANVGIHCSQSPCLESSKKSSAIAFLIGVIAIVTGGAVIGLFVFAWYCRRKQRIGSTFEVSDGRINSIEAKDLSRRTVSPLISLEYSNGWDPFTKAQSGLEFSQEVFRGLRFNLEEVESSTQHFSEVNLLGKSNIAAVYRGILRDGSVVAIKSINKTSCKTEEVEFLRGLKILASLQHENLVRLRGFCCSRGRGECFLIYDFAKNGSLSQYLDVKDDSRPVLDWPTRVSIINGIAKGLLSSLSLLLVTALPFILSCFCHEAAPSVIYL